ncbi:MAG: winged helix-turn-helix domain-containing protein [Actinomycetota bacterium]|nr:winged helix-turn-helix domain-containing protein [Actinomycetota bacterium]
MIPTKTRGPGAGDVPHEPHVPRSRRQLDDGTRMAKALGHPLRAKLLARLNEGVASPNELAGELGEPLGNVSYHVRTLLELDCIELVDTAHRRGAVEHYYRATSRAVLHDAAWAQLPPTARRGLAVQWFKDVFGDVSDAIDGGRFDRRSDTHMTFTPLILDEQAWRELGERLGALCGEALDLQAESLQRLSDGERGGEQVLTRLVVAHYEGTSRSARSGKPGR